MEGNSGEPASLSFSINCFFLFFHLQRSVQKSRTYLDRTLLKWKVAGDAVSTEVMAIEPSTFAKLAFANSDTDDYVLSAVGNPLDDAARATETNMAQLLAMDLSEIQADATKVAEALQSSLDDVDSGKISVPSTLTNHSDRAAHIFHVWSGRTRTARADRELVSVKYEDVAEELAIEMRRVMAENILPMQPNLDDMAQAAIRAVMDRYKVCKMERIGLGGVGHMFLPFLSWNFPIPFRTTSK